MAHYSIISSQGQHPTLFTGAPRYVGAYLKPGYLEFQEIGSPSAIDWHVGDYVVYERTGRTYRLYGTPNAAEQARANRYGAAFLYENVQFFDDVKQLELCPFTDLVPGDNTVHFSTQGTISFFGKPSNVAERIQACLENQYGANSWAVKVVTTSDADLLDVLNTEVEFSVSGVNCLEVLDKVYETWNNLGWAYTIEDGKNTITIGAPNARTAANTTEPYSYGSGLVRVEKSIVNADNLGTRLFAYGSMKNMDATYYRGLDIYNAESVDIEHLMIPLANWGTTSGKPDARKAYIQDASAIANLGLIPRTAYFDGTGDLPDIHPTIERLTIGEVYDAGGAGYIPDLSKWSRDQRVDEVINATTPDDHGTSAERGQKYAEIIDSHLSAVSASGEEGAIGQDIWTGTTTKAGRLTLQLGQNLQTFTVMSGWTNPVFSNIHIEVHAPGAAKYIAVSVFQTGTNTWAFRLPESITLNEAGAGTVRIYLSGYVFRASEDDYAGYRTYTFATDSSTVVSASVEYELQKTFVLRIPQIGFDIDDYAALGNGKTISMKTGMCAGRDFEIKDAAYVSSADAWDLTIYRSVDEDLNIMFPNTDYPIAVGDQFVLLDIAMPEMYVTVASNRLLAAAQKLLADMCVEQPFYSPQIDAKVVFNESRVLLDGMWMDISFNGVQQYALIDSITIDENGSNIPTYEIALRQRKGIDWAENIGTSSSGKSSVSVSGSDVQGGSGAVTSVGLSVPPGLSVEGSPVTGAGVLKVNLAPGYKIPLESELVSYFEINEERGTEVDLKSAYSYFGTRSGILFETTAESDVASSPAHLMLRNLGTAASPNYALYSPLPLITGGDQIIGSGTPGSGGGGGCAGYLYELGDIYHDNDKTKVLRPNGQQRDGGDVLSFDSDLGVWVALPGNATQNWVSQQISALNLGTAATYGVASSVSQNDNTHLVTGAAVWTAIDNLPEPMVFKGSLGVGGTIQALPVNGSASIGDTYKVITAGTYAGKTAKVGDTFICDSKGSSTNTWTLIPSGDEPEGTVTSVGISLPVGLALGNGSTNPITAAGAFNIEFSSGYSIPLTADVTKGVTAYGYFDASGNAKSALKLTTVNKSAWGQTYWTPDGVPTSISGDMSLVGNVTPSANKSKNLGSSTALWAKVYSDKYYLTDSVYFYTETVNNVVCVHLNAPFITDGDQIVNSGTPGQGGGGSGAGYLYELGDVYHDTNKTTVLREDGTQKQVGDVLQYLNATKGWVAVAASSIGGVTSVVNQTGNVTVTQIADALTSAGYKLTDTVYTLPLAANGTRGGIQIGFTTSAANRNYAVQLSSEKAYVNVPWVEYSAGTAANVSGADTTAKVWSGSVLKSAIEAYPGVNKTGTVTSVKVGSTSYSPSSGVVSLPAYPTTLPASDVYAWAKAATKPSYTLDEVTDGSTRKLSDYVLKSGDTMTGDLVFSRTKGISSYDATSGGTARSLMYLSSSNNLIIGSGLNSVSDGRLYLRGTYIRFQTSPKDGSYTDAVYINDSQNVTIGSSNLASTNYRFYVSGNSYYNGTLSVVELATLSGGATIPVNKKLTIGDAEIEWIPNGGNGYLRINKPLLTVGDQIVNSGTPGGGGSGGGAGFLYELGDVLTDSDHTVVKQYNGTDNAANNNLFAFNGSKWYALKLGSNLAISSGTLNATNTTYSNGTGLDLSNGVFSITTAYQTKIDNGASAYGTLTTSQAKNKVLASPSSASGAPSFRALVAADLPSIEDLTNFSTRVYDATTSRTANYVLAAPNGSNGAATFRKLVAADIPSLTVSKITDIASNYVSIATANTITAKHTFSNGILLNTASSWTSSYRAIAFSADGEDANIRYYYTDDTKGLAFNPNTGALRAGKFVKNSNSGGFLKADGSEDVSTYVPTGRTVNGKALSSNITLSLDDVADGSTRKLANYLPLAGGTMTGNLKWGSITALPSTTSTSYILCIDAFADGGTTKYISTSNLLGGYVLKAGDSMSGSLAICLTPSSSYPVDRTKANLIIEDDSAAATGEIQGGNIIISRGYTATANQSAGAISFYGRRLSGGYRNGARIASISSVVGNTYDRQDLVFYTSNNTNDSSVSFEEAMRIRADKAVNMSGWLSVSRDGVYNIYTNNTASDGTATGIRFQLNSTTKGGLFVSSDENLYYSVGTASTGNRVLTSANYDSFALPLSAGSSYPLTGHLYLNEGLGIQAAGGVGLLVYHPTSGWTGIDSTQWGLGSINSQGVIRSNTNDLLHYKGSSSYSIWDASNSGISTKPWACSTLSVNTSLTLPNDVSILGTLTDSTTASMIKMSTSNNIVVGSSSFAHNVNLYGTLVKFYAAGTTAIGTVSSTGLDVTGTVTASGIGTFDRVVLSNSGAVSHIEFTRAGWNYVSVPTDGVIALNVGGSGSANTIMAVTSDGIRPGAKDSHSCGLPSVYWGSIYGKNLYLGGDTHNTAAGSIIFSEKLDSQRNGFKIAPVHATSANRVNLVFYRSNNGNSPWAANWTTFMTLSYDGKVTIAGSLTTSGDQVISSDASLKKNWRDLKYGVADIAKATAGVFDWKDGKGESAGTKAQDWMHLVPQLVHGEEGHMTLAYGQIAMLNTILLARRSEDHETRIKALELENAELKKEIERLRS